MYVVFRGEALTDVMCYLCSPADVQRFIESVRGESRPYWQGPYNGRLIPCPTRNSATVAAVSPAPTIATRRFPHIAFQTLDGGKVVYSPCGSTYVLFN